jgi:hypothetical protein
MTVPIMAHSNLKLKTYLTGSRTSRLDVRSLWNMLNHHMHKLLFQMSLTFGQVGAKILCSNFRPIHSLFQQIARTTPKSDPKYITWDALHT